MANWGNVKVGFGKDAKVTSHERVEDTDPETYCYRGLHFSGQGKYIEAEEEYLKAVKFSGNNDGYVKKLLSFYYATKRADFEQKANRLFSDWWWRQGENQFFFYVFMCIICFSVASMVFNEGVFSTLIIFGPTVLLIRPWDMVRKSFIYVARGEGSTRQLVSICIGLVAWLVMSVFITESGLGIFFYRVDSLGIMWLISLIIVIAGMIGSMISLYKAGSVLQDGVSRWKASSRKTFFQVFLALATGGGIFIILGISFEIFYYGL